MKKLIIIIILLQSLTAGAQIQTGTHVLSGIFQINTNNSKETNWQNDQTEYKNLNYNISPSYGYYISENVAIGLGVGYSSYDDKTINSSLSNVKFSTENKNYVFNFSPFVRITHPIIEHLYCNLNIYFSYGIGSDESDYTSPSFTIPPITGNQTSMSIGISPGLDYFLNNHFALTFNYANLYYIATTSKPKNPIGPVIITTGNGTTEEISPEYTTSSSGFNFNFGVSSISFGLRYYIHCKEEKK